MTGVTVLIAVVAAIVQLATDKRITPGYLRKSSIAVVLYLAYTAVGVAALVWLMPQAHGPHATDAMLIAFLAWIGLGVLALIRFAPRLQGQSPPQFLEHVGVLDAACLAVMIGAIVAGLEGY